ncbi:hypothetical protein Moror_10758 [Moniliophthora roreri MCA 2997]|uniref:Uncharacterized protein n=1 Tax=Moniliophthora roreri (strain MCA 2997) TaxID=1381753 RepID=V2Y8R4_MONRO|nr:hypothetical protein Moror_10758 [Moniliophthora roreri MCA 2997]
MAIPVPMQELFTVQSVFVKPITAVGLTLLLSGFYILLLGQSLYFLSTRRDADNRRLHLTWITSLFFVAIAASFINAAGDVWDSVTAFQVLQTQDIMSFVAYSQGNKDKTGIIAATYLGYVLMNCISDSFLIHRLYVVWGSSRRAIAFPVVASVAVNAVGLATAITKIIASVDTSNPALYELYKKTINYQIGCYCANPPVNVMIILMIAGRIWWVARDIRRAIPGPRQSKAIHRDYKTVIAMTLESGLVYSMVRIVHAVLAGNAGAIGVPINLAPASILVAGIAPTFVILQSNLIRSVQRGQTDKTEAQKLGILGSSMAVLKPLSAPYFGCGNPANGVVRAVLRMSHWILPTLAQNQKGVDSKVKNEPVSVTRRKLAVNKRSDGEHAIDRPTLQWLLSFMQLVLLQLVLTAF